MDSDWFCSDEHFPQLRLYATFPQVNQYPKKAGFLINVGNASLWYLYSPLSHLTPADYSFQTNV